MSNKLFPFLSSLKLARNGNNNTKSPPMHFPPKSARLCMDQEFMDAKYELQTNNSVPRVEVAHISEIRTCKFNPGKAQNIHSGPMQNAVSAKHIDLARSQSRTWRRNMIRFRLLLMVLQSILHVTE